MATRRTRGVLLAIAVALIAPLLVLAGCGGSGDGAGTREAANSSSAALPTAVFAGTTYGGIFYSGTRASILRCELPSGPCRALAEVSGDPGFTKTVQYAVGRVFARVTASGTDSTEQVVSCSSSVAGPCVKLLSARNPISGPVEDLGRVLFIDRGGDSLTNPGGDNTLYSCDPATTKALADCTARPFAPLASLVAAGPGEVAGAVDKDIRVCRVQTGECRTVGTMPLSVNAIGYVPQFNRLYIGLANRDGDGYFPLWTCSVSTSGSCNRLDRFGDRSHEFIGIGTSLYVAVGKGRIMACDPEAVDRCSTLSNDDLGITSLQAYGDALLVGTSRDDTEGSWYNGGLYLRPLSGGQTTLRDDARGGIYSLTTNASDATAIVATTVVRYTPKDSGVTATGRVTITPTPQSGDGTCVLGAPEVPVTCTSTFARGTAVTLTAEPGPQSALNTWQGAASQCNEPGGAGTPPATTCTVTLDGRITSVTVGFRPAPAQP